MIGCWFLHGAKDAFLSGLEVESYLLPIPACLVLVFFQNGV